MKGIRIMQHPLYTYTNFYLLYIRSSCWCSLNKIFRQLYRQFSRRTITLAPIASINRPAGIRNKSIKFVLYTTQYTPWRRYLKMFYILCIECVWSCFISNEDSTALWELYKYMYNIYIYKCIITRKKRKIFAKMCA